MHIPLLTRENMTIFHGKKIIIYGFGSEAKKIYEIFNSFDIEVVAFCSDALRHRANIAYKKTPIISSRQLAKNAKKYNSTIIQCVQFEPQKLARLKLQFSKLGFEVSPIDPGQLISSFSPAIHLKSFRQNKMYRRAHQKWEFNLKRRTAPGLFAWFLNSSKNHIILCLPTKTADHSIGDTFDFLNKTEKLILHENFFHKPKYIKKHLYKKRFKKLKIITAVREPISQNLSIAYQEFACGGAFEDWIIGNLDGKNSKEKTDAFLNLETLFLDNASNVQLLWDAFVARYIYPSEKTTTKTTHQRSIQQFIPEFKKYMLDITAHPFDQEKGYTIIKDGNVEVFIYQLEKLNNIVPALSSWVGVPFNNLEKGNQASDKWIAESYQQAQKELKITQEYFDKCFDEPYVKHCYSEADIEKFKARWQPHIEKEA